MNAGPSAPLSLRAYARHRGVALRAVQKAIEEGRLSASVVLVPFRGGQTHAIANAQAADEEWDRNTDHSQRRSGGSPGEPPPPRASAAPAAPTGGAGDPPARAAADESEEVGGSFSDHNKTEKAYRAKLARLEYEERAKLVVPIADVREAWALIVNTAKTKLLAIPSKCRSVLPHLTHEDIAALDRLQREALEEVAAELGDSGKAQDPPA